MDQVSNKDVWERTNFETDIKQMGLSWKQLERITQDTEQLCRTGYVGEKLCMAYALGIAKGLSM